MVKQRTYEIATASEQPESKKERKARERNEHRMRRAAFALPLGEAATRQEKLHRHTSFDDKRRKDRNQKSKAIQEYRDE